MLQFKSLCSTKSSSFVKIQALWKESLKLQLQAGIFQVFH